MEAIYWGIPSKAEAFVFVERQSSLCLTCWTLPFDVDGCHQHRINAVFTVQFDTISPVIEINKITFTRSTSKVIFFPYIYPSHFINTYKYHLYRYLFTHYLPSSHILNLNVGFSSPFKLSMLHYLIRRVDVFSVCARLPLYFLHSIATYRFISCLFMDNI